MQLGEVLRMMHVGDIVRLKILTLTKNGPKVQYTKPLDRWDLEKDMCRCDIDPDKVYAVSISAEDNVVVVCVDGLDWDFEAWADYDTDFEPFVKWVDFEESRKRAKGHEA